MHGQDDLLSSHFHNHFHSYPCFHYHFHQMDRMASLWPFDNMLQHHVYFTPTTSIAMDIFIKSLFQGPIPY